MQVMKAGIKKSGIIEKISFRAYHKNGSIKYLEGTAKNMLHSPIVNGIIINYRDVSERKKAEKALKESENRLSKTMKAAIDGMWDWDLKKNKVYFDHRLQNIYSEPVISFSGFNRQTDGLTRWLYQKSKKSNTPTESKKNFGRKVSNPY